MNTTKTNIIDSNSIDKSDTTKILLMDSLIEHFSPLFYEDLRKKQRQVRSNEADVTKLKAIVERNKSSLLKMQTSIKVEEVKSQILKEIEYLSNMDVLYGKNKITVQSIISALDKLSLENLEKRLALLKKLVKTKRG